MLKPSKIQPPIVVVGMGPGGIITAIEAAEQGHEVVIIENRDYFTRSQRVIIDRTNIDYLSSLNQREQATGQRLDSRDEEFIIRLNQESTVQVNLLQEFLEKKLRNIYGAQIMIRRGRRHQVKSIDLHNNTIQIESNSKLQSIAYSHIVGADGARHEMANKIAEATINLKNIPKIKYRKLEQQTRQEPHGTISLRYNQKSGSAPRKKRKLSFKDLPQLATLGWDEPYLPKVYMFQDLEKRHFYLAGEIPRKILDEPDKQQQRKQLEEWGKLILKLQYGFQEVDKFIELDLSGRKDEKSKKLDELKATAFPVTLQYSEAPCIKLPRGNAFVLVGDASKNANFHLGHGANDAIRDGLKFGNCVQSGKFNFHDYRLHQQGQMKKMITGMQNHQQKMLKQYDFQMTDINKEIIKHAQILTSLAKLHTSDYPLLKAAQECEKCYSKRTLHYDEIYDKTIKLTDMLNTKSLQVWEDEIAKLSTKSREKSEKLKQSTEYTQSTLFKMISFISSSIGKHLQIKNEAAKQELEIEIQLLNEKSKYFRAKIEEKVTQQTIVQPRVLIKYKNRVKEIIDKHKKPPSEPLSPRPRKNK